MVTEAVPFEEPQDAGVVLVINDKATGWLMIAAADEVHPFASVTVTLYVPDGNPVVVADDPPAGNQLYENTGVPPLTDAVAVPLLEPLQRTASVLVERVRAAGCVTPIVDEVVQPEASVTVTV